MQFEFIPARKTTVSKQEILDDLRNTAKKNLIKKQSLKKNIEIMVLMTILPSAVNLEHGIKLLKLPDYNFLMKLIFLMSVYLITF